MRPYINKPLTKGRLKQLVAWSLHVYGVERSVALVERLKNLGFAYATIAGLSLGIDDLTVPDAKDPILASSQSRLRRDAGDVDRGLLTPLQYFGRVITVWNGSNEALTDELLAAYRRSDSLNPVLMMAFSGARGNISQVRQLVGMRGLMADATGQIKDFAVQSNFREGLSLTEYLIACYGSRKGVVDTALKTATSGYLTRRLVDVAQHVVVTDVDCGSRSGFLMTGLVGGGRVVLSLRNRLIGRVLCADTSDSRGTLRRNREIDDHDASRLCRVPWVNLRSPLTCLSKRQVCRRCYGWNLALGRLVGLGETVGVMAAQSIGEPGTQLTMRTFHTGGVFSGNLSQAYRSPDWCRSGRVVYPEPVVGLLVRNPVGAVAYLTKSPASLVIVGDSGPVAALTLPSHSLMTVKQGQRVSAGAALGESADATRGYSDSVRTIPSRERGEVKTPYVIRGRAHQVAIWDGWPRSRRVRHDRRLRGREEWATPTLLKLWRSRRRRHHVDSANSAGSYFWVVRGERQTFSVPGVCPYQPGDRFALGVPLVWRRTTVDPRKVRPGPGPVGRPRTSAGCGLTVASWAGPYGFTRDALGVRAGASARVSPRRGRTPLIASGLPFGTADPGVGRTCVRPRRGGLTQPSTPRPRYVGRGACDRFRSHRVLTQRTLGPRSAEFGRVSTNPTMGRLQSTVSGSTARTPRVAVGKTPVGDAGRDEPTYPNWFGEIYYVFGYRLHPKYLRRRSRGTKYYHSQRVARPTQIHNLSQALVDLIPHAVSHFNHDLTTRVRHALSNGLDQASDGGRPATVGGITPNLPLARLSPTDLIAEPERGRHGQDDRPGGLYTQQVSVPLPYSRAEISGLTYVRTYRGLGLWGVLPRDPTPRSVETRSDSGVRPGSDSGCGRSWDLRPVDVDDRRKVHRDRTQCELQSQVPADLHPRRKRTCRPALGTSSTSVVNRAGGTDNYARLAWSARRHVRVASGRKAWTPPTRTWSTASPARIGRGGNVMVNVRQRTAVTPTNARRHDRAEHITLTRGYVRDAFGVYAYGPRGTWERSKSLVRATPKHVGRAKQRWGFRGSGRHGPYARPTYLRGRTGRLTQCGLGLTGPNRRSLADLPTRYERHHAAWNASSAIRLANSAGRRVCERRRGRTVRRLTAWSATLTRVADQHGRHRSTGSNPVIHACRPTSRLWRELGRGRRRSQGRLESSRARRRVWLQVALQVTHAGSKVRRPVSTSSLRRDVYGRYFLKYLCGGAHGRGSVQPRPLRAGPGVTFKPKVEAHVKDRPGRPHERLVTTWFRCRSRMADTNLVQVQRRVLRSGLVYDELGSVGSGRRARSKPSRAWRPRFQVPIGATVWSRRRRPKRPPHPAAGVAAPGMTARSTARTWRVTGLTRFKSTPNTIAGGGAPEPRATKKTPVVVYDQPWPRYQPNLNLGLLEPVAVGKTRPWRCAWVDRDLSRHVRPRPKVRDRRPIRGLGVPNGVCATVPVSYFVTRRRDAPRTDRPVAQHRRSDRVNCVHPVRHYVRQPGPFGTTVNSPYTPASKPTRTRTVNRVGSGNRVEPRRVRRGRHVSAGVPRRDTRTTLRTARGRTRQGRPGTCGFWAMTTVDYGLHAGLKPRVSPAVLRHADGQGRRPALGGVSGDVTDAGWTAWVHGGTRDTLTPYAVVPTGRCGPALRDPAMPDRGSVVAPAAGELVYGGPSRKPQAYVPSPTKPWPVYGRPADELRYLTTACVIHYRHDAARTNLTIGGYVHVESRLDGNRRNRTAGQVLTVSGARVTLRRGWYYPVPTHSRCDVTGDAWVERGQGLMAVRYRNLMTGDIVQGIPKVERVFEARANNGLASLPALLTRIYDRFDTSAPSTARLQEVVVSRSVQSVVRFALNSVQGVYQSQGVVIADKHVEIILRQMTAKVSITYPGDSGLLFGDLVYVAWIRVLARLGRKDKFAGGNPTRRPSYRPPLYVPCIHGITKTALGAQGFLAAASFQETTRILAQAAAAGRRDFLQGLKGNVILGARLPMGTGRMSWRNRPDSGTRGRVTPTTDDQTAPVRGMRTGVVPTARGRRSRTLLATLAGGTRPGSRRYRRVFGPPAAAPSGLTAEESFRLSRSTNWRPGFAGPNPGPTSPTTPRLTRLRYGRLRLLRRYGYRRLYRTALRHRKPSFGLEPRDLGNRARPRRRPRRPPWRRPPRRPPWRRRGRDTVRGSKRDDLSRAWCLFTLRASSFGRELLGES